MRFHVACDSGVGNVLIYGNSTTFCLIFSFYHHICDGFGDHNFCFLLIVCIIFLFFLRSFMSENEWSTIGFSVRKLKIQHYFTTVKL